MAAKIAKVQIAPQPGRWGGYKVREISDRGAVLNSYDIPMWSDAVRAARFSALANKAELVMR